MDPVQKDTLFQMWSKVNEITLIKVVSSRGQHVDLCLEFLARSKNIAPEDAFDLFHEVVDTYVFRLLSQNQIDKAQQVLNNVQRDYKTVYYQFAIESTDDTIRNAIYDHLRKDNEMFDCEKAQYEFYLGVLKEIKSQPKLSNPIKRKLKLFNLENLFKMSKAFRNKLVIRLYMFNKAAHLLYHIKKEDLWEYLIDENQESELIAWCQIQKGDTTALSATNELHKKYLDWKIEPQMLSYVSKYLKTSNEEFRDLLLFYGFIFDDEKNDVKKLSDRIIRTNYTQILDDNIGEIKSLPIAEYLVQNDCFIMLLQRFIQIEDIENLKQTFADKVELFDLIIALKSFDEPTRENYLKISRAIINFMKRQDESFLQKNPLFAIAEFLVAGKEIETLVNDDSEEAKIIKSIPFIDNLLKRLYGQEDEIDALELFKMYSGIDLKEVKKNEFGGQPVSFKNPHLINKYAMKFDLNYTHFIRLKRSTYAVYEFIKEQVSTYGKISRTQFQSAVETVTEMAVAEHKDLELTRHCIIFIEQLGFDSQNLRCLLCLLRICDYDELFSLDYKDIIERAEEKLFGDDESMEKIHKDDNFPVEEYSALINVAKFAGKQYWPTKYLKFLALKNDWFKLIVLLQHFDIPLDIMKSICDGFENQIVADNFYRAITYQDYDELKKGSSETLSSTSSKRRPSFKRSRSTKTEKQQKSTANDEPTTSNAATSSRKDSGSFFKIENECEQKFLEGKDDLFALILMSTTKIPEEKITSLQNFLEIIYDNNSYSTSLNFLKKCVKHELPILAILSADVYSENADWCWLVWLGVSTDYFKILSSVGSYPQNNFGPMLIEKAAQNKYIQTLYNSFHVFYNNPFIFLLKFMEITNDFVFDETCISQLKQYYAALKNAEIRVPFSELQGTEIIIFSIRILLHHIDNTYTSQYHQLKCIEMVVESELEDFNEQFDFVLLHNVFELVMGTDYVLNFASLIPCGETYSIVRLTAHNEYKNILDMMLEAKDFDKAIKLAHLIENVLDKPLYSEYVTTSPTVASHNIVMMKWITELDLRQIDFNFGLYERDVEKHSLPPDFLVNFYLYATVQFADTDFRRYLWYKNALEVIKKNKLFRNESFDFDQIEFDMIMVYLKNDKKIEDIEIYHSEYYEEILARERNVLYKSFAELQELAGVSELNKIVKTTLTSEMQTKLTELLDHLLDQNDIIEAIRLQALFDYSTVDLKLLTFCMMLAEGKTSIENPTEEERSLFTNLEISIPMFSKLTLQERRLKEQEYLSAFRQRKISENNAAEFVEIPTKEKKQIFERLQGLTGSLKHGRNIGKRIMLVYRCAMYLDKEYTDILRTKDTSTLLASATSDECIKKLLIINDIFTSNEMTADEIAEYLSHEIITAIVRPVFYLLTTDQQNIRQIRPNLLWGYDLEKEFHLILELCPKPSLLGTHLLKYCDVLNVYRRYQNNEEYERTPIFELFYNIIQSYGLPNESASTSTGTQQVLSYKKKNTINIELLIVAYKSFVQECHMEGMIDVLNRTQALNLKLEAANSWKLIARMLTGIGQYREMSYCFETLIKYDQFECLLGAQYDEEKSKRLKYAIVAYLREFYPTRLELIKLVAVRFAMYTELAEMSLSDANARLSEVLEKYQTTETDNNEVTFVKYLPCSFELVKELEKVRDDMAHAAENYLFDEKLGLAGKTAQRAQLIAMQLGIINETLSTPSSSRVTNHICVNVLSVQMPEEFCELVNNKLEMCYQAMILTNSYPDYAMQWHEVLLWQYIIHDHDDFLEEFCCHFELNDSIIENMVQSYQKYCKSNVSQMKFEKKLEDLIEGIESVTLKYRLASHMGFMNIVTEMLNDGKSIYYLKDTEYGAKEFTDDG